VQNDMSTAVTWSKSKSEVEFQYGGRLDNKEERERIRMATLNASCD